MYPPVLIALVGSGALAATILAGCSAPSLPSDRLGVAADAYSNAAAADDGTPASDDASLDRPDLIVPTADAPATPPFVDPYDGALGCDGSVDAASTNCEIVMPFQGGLSTVAAGKGDHFLPVGSAQCNPVDHNGLDVSTYDPNGLVITVVIRLAAPLVVSNGAPAAASVEIIASALDGGGGGVWMTLPQACNVVFSSEVCAPTSGMPDRYGVSGTGKCSQPAGPLPGTTGAPISIGDFYFVGFINPASSDQ